MLRRDSGQSVSFRDGFRRPCSFHMGGVFLSLLTVMLLAAPQLAFGQSNVTVTVSPRSLEIDEGATGTYDVNLDASPAAGVTVTVNVAGTTDAVTVDATASAGLEFTSANWVADTPRTVTVTVGTDLNAVDEVVTLTHTATITDSEDNEEEVTLRNASVTVTVDDAQTQGVTLGDLTPAEVPEAGSATYTVVLDTQPTVPVTVDIGGTSGEITVSPSRLVFNPTGTVNLYSTEQTVTVFAGEDFDAEDDTATLTHTVRGGDYTGVSANTVPVTVDDNDTRGVTVVPATLNIASGAIGTFTVVLNTQPTNSVRITMAEDQADLSVSPSSLSFSSVTWNRPQTVTVRVASGYFRDSLVTPHPTSVTLTNSINTSSSSRDEAYDTAEVANVELTISNSDTAPAVRLSTSSVTINEGKDATYTVRLATNPGVGESETVTVNVPTGSGFGVDTASLTFAGDTSEGAADATWNTAQTVTVTGPVDDNAVQETTTITHTIGTVIVANSILRATVRESDTRGITITPTSLEVTEGGTARYNIVLDSEPVGDAEDRVTVNVGGVSGDVTVAPSQLLFTGGATGTWQTAQEVVVSAAPDDDGETDAPVTLSHTVRGGDYDRLT